MQLTPDILTLIGAVKDESEIKGPYCGSWSMEITGGVFVSFRSVFNQCPPGYYNWRMIFSHKPDHYWPVASIRDVMRTIAVVTGEKRYQDGRDSVTKENVGHINRLVDTLPEALAKMLLGLPEDDRNKTLDELLKADQVVYSKVRAVMEDMRRKASDSQKKAEEEENKKKEEEVGDAWEEKQEDPSLSSGADPVERTDESVEQLRMVRMGLDRLTEAVSFSSMTIFVFVVATLVGNLVSFLLKR